MNDIIMYIWLISVFFIAPIGLAVGIAALIMMNNVEKRKKE